jgi:hypothetical protein
MMSVILVALAMTNFVAFLAESSRLGGDALNGDERDGVASPIRLAVTDSRAKAALLRLKDVSS